MPNEWLEGEKGTKVKVTARKWQESWQDEEDKEESEDMSEVIDIF